MLWSGETKIEVSGNKHSDVSEVNQGCGRGSVMLWVCLTPKGPGNLIRMHGIMNAFRI